MVTEFAEIGLRIKGLREACDVTVEDMARELEVPVGTYEEWEATGADVPISAIYHMAHHFGVEFTEILTGTDKEFELNAGDSIYFNPEHPHGQRCGGDVPAKFVTIIAE